MAPPEFHYYAQIGGEKIELGQDADKKEDPFKPLITNKPVNFWVAEAILDSEAQSPEKLIAVSNDSIQDADKRLRAQLPKEK